MFSRCLLIPAGQNQTHSAAHDAGSRLAFEQSARLISGNQSEAGTGLADIVFEIQKHPNNLATHVRRIDFCYRENLTESLYAALVDLLIVLNRRGQALGRRMVVGALAKLNPRQIELLKRNISQGQNDPTLLEGNRFSLFSRGLIGTEILINKQVAGESGVSNPLQLAQDAVEYSQLDEAMQILENALAESDQPISVHQLLLELYRSTENQARFLTMFSKLKNLDLFDDNHSITDCWQQLRDYFEQPQREHNAR